MSRETEEALALAVGLALFFLAVRLWAGAVPASSSETASQLVPQLVS